jgi:hypothetical protein
MAARGAYIDGKPDVNSPRIPGIREQSDRGAPRAV